MDEFTTDSIFTKTFAGPSSFKPIILNLDLKLLIFSINILKAIIFYPKVDDSMVFCFFENHDMGAIIASIKIPVCDLRVTLFPV